MSNFSLTSQHLLNIKCLMQNLINTNKRVISRAMASHSKGSNKSLLSRTIADHSKCSNATLLSRTMAGHSKWSNIRHIKSAKDGEKQQIFQKMSRLLRLAITEGGNSDPKLNGKLALAIAQARGNNMPVASIENVLKSFQKSQDNAKPFFLEYKGPGGTYFLLDILTENFKATKQIIASVIKKLNIIESRGTTRHLFEQKGILIVSSKEVSTFESVMDHAIELGAEDIIEDGNMFKFTCHPHNFMEIKKGLEALDYEILYASLDYLPINPITISESDKEELDRIVQRLEDLDDVMKVYINIDQ